MEPIIYSGSLAIGMPEIFLILFVLGLLLIAAIFLIYFVVKLASKPTPPPMQQQPAEKENLPGA